MSSCEGGWTAARIDLLRQRRAAGASFSEIGAELGISRNSAIGKAARLGLGPPAPVGQLPAEQAARLRALAQDGRSTYAMIGAALGITGNRVWKEMRALGLAKPDCRWADTPPRGLVRKEAAPTRGRVWMEAAPTRGLVCMEAAPTRGRVWMEAAPPAGDSGLADPDGGAGKPLADCAPGECRWPLGAFLAVARRFCAAPVAAGRRQPYCAAHHYINRSQGRNAGNFNGQPGAGWRAGSGAEAMA